MFLEKLSRFVRRYEISLAPRHKGGARMPLVAAGGNFSVKDALDQCLIKGEASSKQPNGDVVELMKVVLSRDGTLLTLLFHRESPNAADPMYRKKARAKVTTRQVIKEPGEAQSVSAHLIVSIKELKDGRYSALLEEIPGLSMGVLDEIIRNALSSYEYDFKDKRSQIQKTYCTFKSEGVKSETIAGALKKGKMKLITLTKPASAPFADAEGLFEPLNEEMNIKILGEIDSNTWAEKIARLVTGARAQGWEDFNIKIDLGNKRSRTVRLDREHEAKEVLFIRSDEITFEAALPICSVDIIEEFVQKSKALLITAPK